MRHILLAGFLLASTTSGFVLPALFRREPALSRDGVNIPPRGLVLKRELEAEPTIHPREAEPTIYHRGAAPDTEPADLVVREPGACWTRDALVERDIQLKREPGARWTNRKPGARWSKREDGRRWSRDVPFESRLYRRVAGRSWVREAPAEADVFEHGPYKWYSRNANSDVIEREVKGARWT